MTWKVPGSKLTYRESSHGGLEWSEDGETWYLTFRTLPEVIEMHPTIERAGMPESDNHEREIFGDTLDEPIPDEYWEMLI